MNRLRKLSAFVLFFSILHLPVAQGVDTQSVNPFPGVPYDAEIPGYTVEIDCGPGGEDSSSGVDCGIGRIPWFACPEWSSSDGRNGYANDGPPGDPHKKVGFAKRFCRNSWSPPTNAADEEDFRNRQQIAIAQATLESQTYNASNPGEQKCITWGPIVHANGISTASGGVCANVVGRKPDGSTVAVAPSRVGSESSGGATTNGSSTSPSTFSSTTDTQTASIQPTPSGNQTLVPVIDLTQYGFGRPFTQVVAGNLNASQCPTGFQAATNPINTGFSESSATECWPDNAWAAYSIGGAIWNQFKTSNGNLNAQAEAARRVQVNAIRALALQQAQNLSIQTPGLKRCNNWSAFGEVGQECAYIPIQNNATGNMQTTSSGDTLTSVIQSATEIIVATASSLPGQSQTEWENSEVYKSFACPSGAGRAISIDLNGTLQKGDDIWTVKCIKVDSLTNNSGESSAVQNPLTISGVETQTVTSNINVSNMSNETSTAVITSDPIDFKGTVKKISELIQSLDLSKSEEEAISAVTTKLTNIKATSKIVKIILPNSRNLTETAKSLTPSVCKVTSLIIEPKKAGICQISYMVQGESGNSFETIKKVTFKK
jgi:hypothetical protein